MTVVQPMAHTYIRFNPNPLKLEEWRHHLNLTPTPESPDTIFARALPLFQSAKDSLLRHGWSEVGPLPPGMLFLVQSPVQARQPEFHPMFGIPSELSAFIEHQESLNEWLYSGALAACPDPVEGITIVSPADAKSKRRRQYEDCPIKSMFNLLQLLVVGMFLIVQDERDEVGTFRTCRALPSVDWMMQHEQYLNWVFGEGYFDLLVRRATECPLTAQYIPDAGWWD